MNKPAAKEPSMDEILSSIRQIIADDDSAAERAPLGRESQPADPFSDLDDTVEEDVEPLALSPEQIVSTDDSIGDEDPLAGFEAEARLVVPDAIDFESGDEETEIAFESESAFVDEPEVSADAQGGFEIEDMPAPEPAMRAAASVAEAAPMPDRSLSGDLADKLLAPTADAAVKNAFGRLGALAMGNSNVTLEAMIREMLRPMLKDWLDENLPAIVEQLVEKEIERVSRGGR